jgi:hypothetical protein
VPLFGAPNATQPLVSIQMHTKRKSIGWNEY